MDPTFRPILTILHEGKWTFQNVMHGFESFLWVAKAFGTFNRDPTEEIRRKYIAS
jgi:hypothetical protein